MKNYFKKLVFLIAAAGAIAPAWATDHTAAPGTLSSFAGTRAELYAAPGSAIPYSFSDLLNFTGAAPLQLASAGAVGLATGDGVAANPYDGKLSLTLYDGSNAFGAAKDQVTSVDGATVGLTETPAAGNYSIAVAGNADGNVGGGYLFTIAAVPEPGDWMLLLGGVAVGIFIVRRSRGWAGAGGLTIADHVAA